MSFLTKFFVILHVVLTMLVVSGLVVFVNRVEQFTATNTALSGKVTAAENRATSAENLVQSMTSDMAALKEQGSAQLANARTQLAQAQGFVRERDTQIATSQQNLSSADARLQATTAALQTAQKTVATLQEQLNATRVASDKTQQQSTELLNANADLNSRLQVAQRELRNRNEEVEALQTEIANNKDAGGAARTASAGGDEGTPTPSAQIAINGVINDRKDINGVNTATISVGSRDNVAPGMVFNVIDRGKGDFLGYFRVDRVEDREAVGRLTGPRVGDIKKGNEVRTQL